MSVAVSAETMEDIKDALLGCNSQEEQYVLLFSVVTAILGRSNGIIDRFIKDWNDAIPGKALDSVFAVKSQAALPFFDNSDYDAQDTENNLKP